ncbi:hypothetical protein EYF80_013395 [Liparis tanakae]|uniref:Uncharacterized protein n=1 Tax=Liparis tanakae TaxID=230148 RepID=A0A4Z2IEH2_9TELE|nr:hypothetical protein EYF80_013395 [Liparis tanakae]
MRQEEEEEGGKEPAIAEKATRLCQIIIRVAIHPIGRFQAQRAFLEAVIYIRNTIGDTRHVGLKRHELHDENKPSLHFAVCAERESTDAKRYAVSTYNADNGKRSKEKQRYVYAGLCLLRNGICFFFLTAIPFRVCASRCDSALGRRRSHR